MTHEIAPDNPLERAFLDGDRALVVRFVAEGGKITGNASAERLVRVGFPAEVVQLVLKLAFSRRRLENLCHRDDALGDAARQALAPLPGRVNAAEKKLIDAVVRADSAAVIKLTEKKPGTLRNFSPELCIMLPELTREATVALLTNGFAPAAVPELFQFLLREADRPDVLASMPYRKRLMYANLLIHILQGDVIRPDEDWYPMGNSVEDGGDRSVYCHPHSYCFDPRHRYRPRRADDEYEKPEHDIRGT